MQISSLAGLQAGPGGRRGRTGRRAPTPARRRTEDAATRIASREEGTASWAGSAFLLHEGNGGRRHGRTPLRVCRIRGREAGFLVSELRGVTRPGVAGGHGLSGVLSSAPERVHATAGPGDRGAPLAAGQVPVQEGVSAVTRRKPAMSLADSPATELEDVPLLRGDEFRLEPQTVSLGPSGRPVSAVTLSGMFPVDDKRCRPIINDLPDIIHLPAQLGHQSPLRNVIDLLNGELHKPDIGTESAIGSLLDTLLLFALRAWYATHGAGLGWGPALNDRVISHVLCRINNDPGRPWTVHDLGAEAGLSRSAFARRFTALVGRPPLGYLTWVRMNVAAQTLRESTGGSGEEGRLRLGVRVRHRLQTALRHPPGAYRRQNSAISKTPPRPLSDRQP
nr:AraC family transcriptional regulator [Nonomuraea sp. SYSU D8015]